MEAIGSESFDLDLGRRLFIIVCFLIFMWYFLNLMVNKIKSGRWQIPEFLSKSFPGLKQLDIPGSKDLYNINIIQRKSMPDGSEFLVADIDGRHILLSKHIQSGINYITDLQSKS